MKIMMSMVVAFLSMASAAAAQTRVEGTVDFPGYGEVPSDRVCLTEDGENLHATIRAHRGYVCDRSYLDYSDSTHPKTVCAKGRWVDFPDTLLVTPVWYTAWECAHRSVDYSDSTNPKASCHQWTEVTRSRSLTYKVITFSTTDYLQLYPLSFELKSIVTCKRTANN